MGQRAAGARSLLDVACKHSGSRPQLLIAEVGSGHVVSVGVPQASAGDAHALATMLAQHHMHNVFIPGEVQLWGVSRQASREDRECCKRSHGCRTAGQASPQRPRSRMHTPLSLFLMVSVMVTVQTASSLFSQALPVSTSSSTCCAMSRTTDGRNLCIVWSI